MPQAENLAKALFERIIELNSPAERNTLLAAECGTDQDLKSKVERLLEAYDQAGSFLEHPIALNGRTELFVKAAADASAHGKDTVHEDCEVALDFLEPSDREDSMGRLGQYEILEVVGRGGMGIVLKAHDTKLQRIVAVKVLSPDLASNPTARQRFLREGQAAAAVSHDHVVTIFAVEVNDRVRRGGLPYLVMEFIDGRSLQQKLDREGPPELKEILRIGRQVAAGLAAAHEQGLIHRDVKPSNILLQNGIERVQITDFGLARAADDVSITRTGEVTGTPQYMSPEQAQGHPVDIRSDLFSLGSVLYAICTGRSPFRAESTVASLRRVCDATPRPIREINPDIPEWLVAIVDCLLEKKAGDRFQSANEVAELLGKHLAHLQDAGSSPFPGIVKPNRRSKPASTERVGRWLAAALVLFVVAATFGVTEATGVTKLATTVIRLATGQGILVIEIDDPSVEVSLDGEELTITGAGMKELKLRPGLYQFNATKNGEPLKRELVSITRNGRKVVHVTSEAATSASHLLSRNELIDLAHHLAEEEKWPEAFQTFVKSLSQPTEHEPHPLRFSIYPLALCLKAGHHPEFRNWILSDYRTSWEKKEITYGSFTLFFGQLSPRPVDPTPEFLEWLANAGELQSPGKLTSLALAIWAYRQGDYQHAVDTLKWNDNLYPHYLAATLFFRSMANAQLGNIDQARKDYGEAIHIQTVNLPPRKTKTYDGTRFDPLWYRWAIYDIARSQAEELLSELRIIDQAESVSSEDRAFVVLDSRDMEVKSFNTLSDAIHGSNPGDTIEIRGNGPFVCEPIQIRHPLEIRAGQAVEPVLRCSPDVALSRANPFIDQRVPLILEGVHIEILNSANDGEEDCGLYARAPLSIANCRIILPQDGFAVWSQDDCNLANSILIARADAVTLIDNAGQPQNATLRNSVVSSIDFGSVGHRRIDLNLESTTVCNDRWLLKVWPDPQSARAGLVDPSLRIHGGNNIFDVGASLIDIQISEELQRSFETDSAVSWLLDSVDMQEARFLVAESGVRVRVSRPAEDGGFKWKEVLSESTDWKSLWGNDDHSLDAGIVRFRGGDVKARIAHSMISLKPNDFRLRADSAGYRSGPDGKDLGADVDFVGPGAAYERWKETEAYQMWLKQAKQLMDDNGKDSED